MWVWGRLARVCGGADEAGGAYRGVGADRGICTWGEGDFGDDANVASRRVGDEVADVGLGVKAACAVGWVCEAASYSEGGRVPIGCWTGRLCSCAGEKVEAGDRDAPCRVVGESPVQDVEMIPGHDDEEKLHVGHWPERVR